MRKNAIYLAVIALVTLFALSKVIEALQLSQYLFVHENEDFKDSENEISPPNQSLSESPYWGRRLQSDPCACNRECTVILGRNICYVDGGVQCPFAIPSLLHENQAWIDCPAAHYADTGSMEDSGDGPAAQSASVGEGIGGDHSEGIDSETEVSLAPPLEKNVAPEDGTNTDVDADATTTTATVASDGEAEEEKITSIERTCAGPDGPCVEKTCFGPGEPCILKGVRG